MISVTELRAGRTFEENGEPFVVLKYEHLKMGRGTANIKLKVKNLKSNITTEKTFISGARVQEISTTKRKMQYLYREGNQFYFMDPKSFEQFSVSGEVIGEQGKFLQEGASVDVLFWEDKPLSIELPAKMEFTVAETGPGIKGDSATNIFKPAVLDNGLKLKVPLFINQGEKILVDTRTGEYVERVK
ncbi:MAG: elongation factor P [Patescibacteria group bacterium]